ncbi:MAG: L-fucose transporter [Bacteroidetes bacterium]|nr:L-fucose transporter [Bacteroidota bacterium]
MKKFTFPLVLFVFLFFLWGFAHSILDVLNKHFQDVLVISKSHSALVQVAVYGGYFLMAIPAGRFIKRFSYKRSVIFGLMLFAIGAFMFVPAERIMSFPYFIVSLFVIGCGLTFLETASNPYIVALGDKATGASRLSFAQSFNGLGWIFGPMIGGLMIFNADGSNGSVALPYTIIGLIVLIVALVFMFIKLPKIERNDIDVKKNGGMRVLLKNKLFVFGVIAQFFYVGAQTGINSFFINYVIEFEPSILPRYAALILSLGGMGLFMIGRMVGSFIMKKYSPVKLLRLVAILAACSMILVIFSFGFVSMVALLLTYLFMSIMFPTIFALSIGNLGDNTEEGSSLLVMSIVGGAIVPPLMGAIGENSIALGFIFPLIGFIVVFFFARFMEKGSFKF